MKFEHHKGNAASDHKVACPLYRIHWKEENIIKKKKKQSSIHHTTD